MYFFTKKIIARMVALTLGCGIAGAGSADYVSTKHQEQSSEIFVCIDAKNKFGNIRYKVCDSHDPNIATLPADDGSFWTIQNPTLEVIKYYESHFPACRIRVYNNTPFLMSGSAYEKIPAPGVSTGASVILTFTDQEKQYILLTVDNKKYLQNVSGSSNPNEKPEQTALREVNEETQISLRPGSLKKIGSWSFENFNELIGNYRIISTTSAFSTLISVNDVRHLLPDDMNWRYDPITIVPVSQYSFQLDETQYIAIIPVEFLDNAPEALNLNKNHALVNHTFQGHHREILHRLFKSSKHYDIGYLYSFEFYNLMPI